MGNVNRVVAVGLAGALAATASSSIAAPVLTNTAAVKTAAADDLTPVRWGWGWGWGAGAFIGGLALGAALATPSYAYYGYPSTYGYWGGYPYWGYRTAYWGGYPYGGYRTAYWGGYPSYWGYRAYAAYPAYYGFRRAYYGGAIRSASYRTGVRTAYYRGGVRRATYVQRTAIGSAPVMARGTEGRGHIRSTRVRAVMRGSGNAAMRGQRAGETTGQGGGTGFGAGGVGSSGAGPR